MRETGIYIHIPFCVQKCLYCDFPSFGGQEKEYERYTAALCREIEAKSHLAKDWKIKTVFFGGGTPTVLSAQQMKRILDTVFRCFDVESDAEITTEANPGTLSLEKCVDLRQMGFNRLSMGVQAWQDELLERLGRIHTRQQFLKNFASAREAGFDNINVDLMFALPEQTLGQWEETLSEITALQPEHISAYSLIIEEGTPFYDLYEKEVYQETDEELDRAMYHTAVQILAEEDYHQYEISNFAKEGKESRHNRIYWQDEGYLGFGLGAHSYWEGKRFHNPYDLHTYMEQAENGNVSMEDVEELSLADQYSEFMFMGLRLTEGIEKKRFAQRFGVDMEDVYGAEMEKCKEEGLLEEKDGWLCLTERGLDLSNQVFMEFLKEDA